MGLKSRGNWAVDICLKMDCHKKQCNNCVKFDKFNKLVKTNQRSSREKAQEQD